jgi:cardiolipin synthase
LGWRVIARRAPVTETLYWLAIIILIPVFGGILYVVINEKPLGRKRVKRAKILSKNFKSWSDSYGESIETFNGTLSKKTKSVIKLIEADGLFKPCKCEDLELLSNESTTLDMLITDIENSKSSVNLCSYLWVSQGKIRDLEQSLIKASRRGVTCRVLLDDLGSGAFLDSDRADELRAKGIQVISALKTGVFRGLFRRVDIRNHRKIFTIDGEIAYTGSMNLVDSTSFKPWHDLGGWTDAVIRFKGSAAKKIDFIFKGDWFLETGEFPEWNDANSESINPSLIENRPNQYPVQLVPPGRNIPKSHIHDVYLDLIYGAEKEITLTSPYLIPSDGLTNALSTAAKKGVTVNLITTKKSDAKVVQLASEFHYRELFNSGVNIFLFSNALLHAKTLTVDSEISMVGSLNLDMRSFYINFEICPFIYSKEFNTKLKILQTSYQNQSQKIDENWFSNSKSRRIYQQITRLISPIL